MEKITMTIDGNMNDINEFASYAITKPYSAKSIDKVFSDGSLKVSWLFDNADYDDAISQCQENVHMSEMGNYDIAIVSFG